ncbi:hypothetical protein TcasGA2_TC012459 [Tribolium castaneum]|uniref:Uncharacterized protein n=1 Tax=Tribolium castaneum TaxID=7070 RepID=D6X2E9_TRICA|nr:hypothetical protein TcasGA2_TC012459 [Tribolium castaneum]
MSHTLESFCKSKLKSLIECQSVTIGNELNSNREHNSHTHRHRTKQKPDMKIDVSDGGSWGVDRTLAVRIVVPSVCRRRLRSVTDRDEKHKKNNKIRTVARKNNGRFLSPIADRTQIEKLNHDPFRRIAYSFCCTADGEHVMPLDNEGIG